MLTRYTDPMSPWRDDIPLTKSPLSFFLFVSRPHWRPALAAVSAVSVAALLGNAVPYLFKLIVDAALGFQTGGASSSVLFFGMAYVAVDVGKELIWRSSGYFGSYWSTGARATARYALTSYVTLHSRSFFLDRFAGSLASKIGHAAKATADLIGHFLWEFLGFGISVVASFFLAYSASPAIALIFLGWVVCAVPFNIYRARQRVPIAGEAQKHETKLTGLTVDLLSNIASMQEFARRSFEIGRFKRAITERRTRGLRNWHYGERTLIINGIIQGVFAAGMVLVAVHLAQSGTISPGDIVLILTIIFRMEDHFLFLGQRINDVSENWGEIQESLEEILEPYDVRDKADAQAFTANDASISFEQVWFSYTSSSRHVLEDFSLSIPPGQRVGLVGRSGAGKSTIFKLLLRHYDVTAGIITIGGKNIADVSTDSVREAIAVVPQEPLLFHRSIRDNIAYGRPEANDTEIIQAARLAFAHDFIERLPDGYESMVGERGVKLSGGERQRIVIARAILKDAPVLLLDEATSSLDSESEVTIQKALHELMEGKTVIAIAHRLSTLREMDRLIVMSEGRIVEDGTHEDLLAKGGIYADLWNHQAGGFLQEE